MDIKKVLFFFFVTQESSPENQVSYTFEQYCSVRKHAFRAFAHTESVVLFRTHLNC